jgi:hypothetical protein
MAMESGDRRTTAPRSTGEGRRHGAWTPRVARRGGRGALAWVALVLALLAATACDAQVDAGFSCGPAGPEVEAPLAVADFYVAPNGVDSADGSLERPLRTLTQAAHRARPGDVIMLRGGIYDTVGSIAYTSLTLHGTPDAPITIRSYPGEHAIIDGSRHRRHPRTPGDGRDVTNPMLLSVVASYTIWQDLTFRHGVGRSFFLIGHHNTLRHITSHDNHSDGIYIEGSHNLLEDIESYRNNSIANGGDSADGIKIVSTTTNPGQHNTIRRAITHHNSDDGIDIWNTTHTLVEHSISYANGLGTSGNGNGFKVGSLNPADTRNTIRFNIAYDNRNNNFDTNAGGGITLIHNTSLHAGNHGYVLRHKEGTNPPNTAHNNISYQDRITHIDWPTTTHTHNTWNLAITNPQFHTLDPTHPDYLTLTPTSPAIDRGTPLDPPYTGTTPDLGALQHGETIARTMGAAWCAKAP